MPRIYDIATDDFEVPVHYRYVKHETHYDLYYYPIDHTLCHYGPAIQINAINDPEPWQKHQSCIWSIIAYIQDGKIKVAYSAWQFNPIASWLHGAACTI